MWQRFCEKTGKKKKERKEENNQCKFGRE